MKCLSDKIKYFVHSEDKWFILKNKMISVICRIKYRRSFGNFGQGSSIQKPLYILGKKHIFVGGGYRLAATHG